MIKKAIFILILAASLIIPGQVIATEIEDSNSQNELLPPLDKMPGFFSQSSRVAPDFDSGWVYDNNSTKHQTVFAHNFNSFPTQIQCFFAPSNTPYLIHPLTWYFNQMYSGGPLSIDMSTNAIFFNIVTGAPLFGSYNATTDAWSKYATGYWRVLAWK